LQPPPTHAPPTAATPLLPYTMLLITHQPTVHTLVLSKEGGGGGARPTPQISPTTHPPILKQENLDSSHYSTSSPDTKTTLPLLIGDCHLVHQHPLSLPTRGFRNNDGLGLSGLRVLALPPPRPDPPCAAMSLDCGGRPPHTWRDNLRGYIETLFQNSKNRVDGLKPASTCLWTNPWAQALLWEPPLECIFGIFRLYPVSLYLAISNHGVAAAALSLILSAASARVNPLLASRVDSLLTSLLDCLLLASLFDPLDSTLLSPLFSTLYSTLYSTFYPTISSPPLFSTL